MANLGNNNLLGNQKRRNFIYNPAVSRARDRGSFAAQPVTSTSGAPFQSSVPSVSHESPYKRFKTSHDLPGKRSAEFADEEACRDLPPDAFDDELGALDDGFDDELTAEQFDECDRIVSRELQTQSTSSLPQNVDQRGVSGNNVPSSLHVDPDQELSDDDSLATHCTQEYVFPVCQNSSATTSSKPHSSVSDMVTNPVSRLTILTSPAVRHIQESVDIAKPVKQGDSLLESFVDQSNGSNFFIPDTNLDLRSVGKTASLASNNTNNHSARVVHSEEREMQALRQEIEKLKADYRAVTAKVKTLEEEKFCKDGEIRILRDSLQHFEVEEKRRQGEAKSAEIQQAREQSQREKDLEKQLENLTTQIQFKDREISQMIERNKKRANSSTDASSPLKKKTVNLSEVFPTGSSFFQKTSPEAKTKSPRSIKTGKQNSQRLSEGENSENSTLSGTSSGVSILERMKAQQREADASEREIVQLCAQSFPEIELVQNLLSPQDKECQVPFQHPENRMLNDGGIISLLTLDTPVINPHYITQRTALNETDASHTLRLFDTQATSKLKRSIEEVIQNDSSSSACINSTVLQTLTGLLNHSHNMSLGESTSMAVSSKFKQNHHLPAATNFLALLESHIVHYVEHRTESNEENIPVTCLARHSPTPDSPDSKDSAGSESDQTKNLAALQETALTSLRLLNILVLYSAEVCDCILKSARVFNESEGNQDENGKEMDIVEERRKKQMFSSKEEEGSFCQHPLFPNLKIAMKKDPEQQLMQIKTEQGIDEQGREEEVVKHTDLLGYLFKLLMPQPRESMAIAYATLQVLTSLARNCEVQYYTRMLPLLSDNLLSECLSRDWCLTSLSLVTALFTSLTRHSGIVKRLCSQSDDCILLKIYQGLVFRPADVPVIHYQEVHLQIVGFVNNLLSHSDASNLLFPLESECHCSLELIKSLVLMLDKVINSLSQLSSDSLANDEVNSDSLMLLRQGVFLLATLCLNDRLFVEHRVDVEHQYINVVSSATRLYKRITGLISEAEVIAVQDLVDFERIDGIEWSQESEDEADETVEGMDVED